MYKLYIGEEGDITEPVRISLEVAHEFNSNVHVNATSGERKELILVITPNGDCVVIKNRFFEFHYEGGALVLARFD